jgi:protein-S-isoprenylcysteine O-methyltransferase Ste14
MTNRTKWLVALPFVLLIAFVVPGLVAGEWLWFLASWQDTLYVLLTAAMWSAATGFVDVERPRGAPDLANRLIPLGLVLSVPVAVFDRVHGIASTLPAAVSLVGLLISLVATALGLAARRYLGESYSPRGHIQAGQRLVREGPFRWIRHPMYLAAMLWAIGWPLLLASVFASLTTLAFLLPAIRVRMNEEEAELLRIYGQAYVSYVQRTWRLIPYVY